MAEMLRAFGWLRISARSAYEAIPMVVRWLRPLTVKYRPTATRLILAEHPVEHQGHEQGFCVREQPV